MNISFLCSCCIHDCTYTFYFSSPLKIKFIIFFINVFHFHRLPGEYLIWVFTISRTQPLKWPFSFSYSSSLLPLTHSCLFHSFRGFHLGGESDLFQDNDIISILTFEKLKATDVFTWVMTYVN